MKAGGSYTKVNFGRTKRLLAFLLLILTEKKMCYSYTKLRVKSNTNLASLLSYNSHVTYDSAPLQVQLARGFQQRSAGEMARQEQPHSVLCTQYNAALSHLSAPTAAPGTSDPPDQEVMVWQLCHLGSQVRSRPSQCCSCWLTDACD